MIYSKDINDFQRMKNDAVILESKLDRQRNLPGLLVVAAEWCGYCKQLKSSIAQLDKLVEQKEFRRGGFPVYWVDASDRPGVARAFKAEGFPSIWLVNRQGVVMDKYQGSRLPEELYTVLSQM